MEALGNRSAFHDELSGQIADISWKAIFAGSFVSLLIYFGLLTLGLAVGSSSLEGAAQGTSSAGGIGIGAGIWMIVSIVISIYVGSFSASRVAGALPIRVGRVQGLVITALFFAVLLSQIGSAVGLLGKGIGSAVGALGSTTGELSKNPQIQDLMYEAVGNLNLKSPAETVAQGVASRLVQGDADGAKNYLARQAGITPAQADARIQELRPKVESVLRQTGATAASIAKAVGWVLFFSVVLGALAGIFGGSLGAAMNLRSPMSRADRRAMGASRAA